MIIYPLPKSKRFFNERIFGKKTTSENFSVSELSSSEQADDLTDPMIDVSDQVDSWVKEFGGDE